MRVELSGKIQDLHDDLERKLEDENQNHDIPKLNNEANGFWRNWLWESDRAKIMVMGKDADTIALQK